MIEVNGGSPLSLVVLENSASERKAASSPFLRKSEFVCCSLTLVTVN